MSRIEYLCPTCEKPVKLMSAMRARCKRCRKDFQLKDLQRIRSMTILGAGPPDSGPLWFAKGTASATGAPITTFTITNVSVSKNEILVVYAGYRNAAAVPVAPVSMTWGAQSLSPTASNSFFSWGGLPSFLGLAQWFLIAANGGTFDVIVDITTSSATEALGCAEGIKDANNYLGLAGASNASGTSQATGSLSSVTPGLVVAALVDAYDIANPRGAWTSTVPGCGALTSGQLVGLSVVTLETAHCLVSQSTGNSTISNDLSDSRWIMLFGGARRP